MTRSRLRRPTSKSTTTAVSPPCASAAPSAAVEVVLPTPPLPDVTTRTLAIPLSPLASIQRGQAHDVALKPSLHGLAAQCLIHVVRGLIDPVDSHQLRVESAAEDACP